MTDYSKAIASLVAARGYETLEVKDADDFQIKDTWGIFPFLTSRQNYYFVGSRGAGKSLLVAQTEKLLRSQPSVLICFLDGASYRSIGQDAEGETFKKFLNGFFINILERVKERKNYRRIAKISSIYAGIREWADFRVPLRYIGSLTGQRVTLSEEVTSYVKSHLRLSLDIASVKISLLEMGVVRLGNIELRPLQIDLSATNDLEVAMFQPEQIREEMNKNIGAAEAILSPLVNRIRDFCLQEKFDTIFVLGDDFHFLTPISQVRIIHFLRRIGAQLRPYNISVVVKLFSATNLSPYIKKVLGLSDKEMEIKNIESSLENLEIKRQAIENLLLVVLRHAGWSDDEIRRLFRREVIDLLLILSGGHPRRFLETSAKLIEITQGNLTNLYQDILLSASLVLNRYRGELPIQLGIDGDPDADKYQRFYESAVNLLVQSSGETPYFLMPYATLETHIGFGQWIDDAIAIGDLLEIAGLTRVNQIPYKLVALNPAAAYFKNKNFRISYQDIVDLQMNARSIRQTSALHLTAPANTA